MLIPVLAPESRGFLLKTGNYTILATDPKYIGFDGTADGTFTLPAASTVAGQSFCVYNLTSAHNLFIALSGGDFVYDQDALAGFVVPPPLQGIEVYALPSGDGGWMVLGNAPPPSCLTWANAPIELINSVGTAFSAASSVTTSPAWPYSPIAGSVQYGALMVICATWNSASVTATVADAGLGTWTPVFGSPIVEGSQSSQMWYCQGYPGQVGSETFTVTFSGPVTGWAAAAAFSGVAISSALDVSASAEAASGVTFQGPSVTTTAAEDLVVGFSFGSQALTAATSALTPQSSTSPNAMMQVGWTAGPNVVAMLPVSLASAGAAISLIAAFKALPTNVPMIGLPAVNIQVVTNASATILPTTDVVLVTSLASAIVLTLPAATKQSPVAIIDRDAGASTTNTISVARAGSDTINGGTGNVVVINTAGGSAVIEPDHTSKWTCAPSAVDTINNQTIAGNKTFTGSTTVAGLAMTGTASEYNGVSTVRKGIPSLVATDDQTGQTAAIGTKTIYAVPAAGAGLYRLSWVAIVTTAGSSSSTLGGPGGFQVTYTDPTTGSAHTPLAQANAVATGNTVGTTQLSEAVVVNCKASTNLQYSFGYTASTSASMHYEIHVVVEYLG